jgi:hypothetical protein
MFASGRAEPRHTGGPHMSESLTGDERAELERLRALHADKTGRSRRHWLRWTASAVVLVVAALLALLSVVTVFAKDMLLDTDRYVETVAPLAENDDIREAVAGRIDSALKDRLDLEERTAEALDAIQTRGGPEALDALAAPIASAVEGFIADQVHAIVYSEAFANLWTDVNRTAHRSVDALLTGEQPDALSLKGDTLYLELGPVIEQVKDRLVDRGFAPAAALPDISVEFPVMEVQGIANARAAADLLDTLGWALPLATAVLLAAGILFAPNRRRALVIGALLVAATMIVMLLAIPTARTILLGNLPESVQYPEAVASFYDIVVRFLVASAQTLLTLALVAAVVAWLWGPGRAATALRRGLGGGLDATARALGGAGARTGAVGDFAARHRHPIEAGLVVVGLLILMALNRPGVSGVLWTTFAVLVAVAIVELLARMPHARSAVV